MSDLPEPRRRASDHLVYAGTGVTVDHVSPHEDHRSREDLLRELEEARVVIERMRIERVEAARRVGKMMRRGAGLVRVIRNVKHVAERLYVGEGGVHDLSKARQVILSTLAEGEAMASEPASPWRDASSEVAILRSLAGEGLEPDASPEEVRAHVLLYGDPRMVAAADAAEDYRG